VQAVRQLPQRLGTKAIVHLESSGGYERVAQRVLAEAGIEVRIHNPRKVRRLADARSTTAKTDAIDAKHLAKSGHLLTATQLKSAERQALCDISRTITALKSDISKHKKRLGMPGIDECSRKALLKTVRFLEKQVAQLQKDFVARTKTSTFARRYELAKSVPGVGPELARVLVSELPDDLSELDRRRVASYAGVAPIDRSSGKFKGTSHTGRGNTHLKQALYMPALSVVNSHAWAKDLFERQRALGKHFLVAIIAVMRRLLCHILAVLKRESPWKENLVQIH
jgi:transposase